MLWFAPGPKSGGNLLVGRWSLVVGDLDAVLERRAGEHVRDELVAVEASPALLGGVEQLVGHRACRVPAAGTLGHASAQLDRGEAALDRVAGPEVTPVLGGEVVER